MKAPHFVILVLLVSALSSFAADPVLPDCAKAFPTEKLWNQTKLGGIETYGYMTNLAFKDLKSKFLAFLGEGWTEDKQDAKSVEEMNATMKKQKVKMLGNATFSNEAKFPGVSIGLTQMETDVKLDESMRFMVNVTVMKMKAIEKKVDFAPAGLTPKK